MKILYLLVLCSYYIIHSALASESVKKHLQPKWISVSFYRIFYNLIALVGLFPIAFLYFNLSHIVLFETHSYLVLLAKGIFILGSILLLIALRQYNLSEFIGTERLPATSFKLVKSGLNSSVRHPLYFATLLILWSWFFISPTDLRLMTALVSTVYIYVGTKLEEKKLIDIFGKEYIDYQEHVPMLIPGLKITPRGAK